MGMVLDAASYVLSTLSHKPLKPPPPGATALIGIYLSI
jgi:hypothetical protein